MTHIITSLCLRFGCVDVCPVECIVPGNQLRSGPGIISTRTLVSTAALAFRVPVRGHLHGR
jgi:hypothetical protein